MDELTKLPGKEKKNKNARGGMKGVFTNYKSVPVSAKQHRPPARLSLEAIGFLPTWLPTFSCISLFSFHVFSEGCHRRTLGYKGMKIKTKKKLCEWAFN